MINLLAFFQEFTFDTLIALISCIAAVVALFLGGKAYQNCQIKNNKFGGKKVIKDESDDHSQTAENITNNTYNGLQVAETTALLNFTHATFKECIFDLLVSDKTLSKEEIKAVKKLAQVLLAKIKARIHELDHWRDKEETQSIISVLIRDALWAELPSSYDDSAIAKYRQLIYEYIYQNYPAA